MTAAEERRRALEMRLGLSKAHGTIVSIVFFVLTLLGVAALFGLATELEVPKGWTTAILSIALAEYLIRRFGFWQTGVESALWLGGLYAWIFGLPGEGKVEVLLLFAAASAIAGWRVRNPFFSALAALFVIVYFGEKHWDTIELAAGIATAAGALAARVRQWQRPSTENFFIALMVVSPVVAVVHVGFFTVYLDGSIPWACAYVALAVAEITFGEIKRDRAALIAAAINVVIAVVLLREIFDFLALEWKLIASGAAIFAIATLVSRRLHDRTRGLVVTPVKHAYEEALRIFGTAAFAPVQTVRDSETVGAGGSFGGAGSTGDY